MKRLYFLLIFFVTTGFAQTTTVDVFPLCIGRQWTYHYSYFYYDGFMMFGSTDTGTVSLLVIKKTNSVDSLRWFVKETSHFGSTITVDTFIVVEKKTGNHSLYRTGDVDETYKSVLPLLPNLADTIYRYAAVDTSGNYTIYTRDYDSYRPFAFHFKQGVGLNSVSMSDGCTCLTYYYTAHSLLSSVITGVDEFQNDLPIKNSSLNQNYPNPFNPSTTFSFSLQSRSFVSLKVFDLLGREVAAIASEELSAGNYTRQWNASRLPSGVYFYRLQTGSSVETKKLVLLK
jgi:hypothetical protein